MKASVIKSSPHYFPAAVRLKVTFNGLPVKGTKYDCVLEASEEDGYIIHYAMDDDGNCIIDNDEFLTVTSYGTVELESTLEGFTKEQLKELK